MTIPINIRARFAIRRVAIRTLKLGIRCATKLQWAWAVFAMMDLQRRMGWNFEVQ
jgi:hypothetical protein